MDEKALKLLEEIRDEIKANREYSAKLMEENRKKVLRVFKWAIFAVLLISLALSLIF